MIGEIMQAFDELRGCINGNGWMHPTEGDIKQKEETVMKGLKALEVIKMIFDKCNFKLESPYGYGLPVLRLKSNDGKYVLLFALSEDEYDLLKEVLL